MKCHNHRSNPTHDTGNVWGFVIHTIGNFTIGTIGCQWYHLQSVHSERILAAIAKFSVCGKNESISPMQQEIDGQH